MQFQRSITPLGLLFAGVGSVIGSGWLFGPLYAAQIAGPASVLSWIIGGLLMIIIALTFAELGSAFPIAGGLVQFAQFSHGPLISFMTGWMVWISSIAVAPVETMGLLQYAGNYIPNLVTKIGNTTVLTYPGIFAGAALMLVMCILNYQGAKFFSRSNNIITGIKLIVPIATLCILLSIDFHSSNFSSASQGGFMPMGWHGVLSALPLGGVIYSFIGSNTVLQLAGETKRPQFSIPLALIVSVIFCIILYALLEIAFVGALTPATLAEGWTKLHYAGDSGPFSGILMAFGLTWFVIVIYGDALISPFGTAYVYTAATARVTYGLSKIGFLPAFFQKLNKHHVPTRAILVNYFAGLFLFLPFPGWQSMVGFIISCFIVSYIIGPIALIGLRKTQPNISRPFKLPCVHLIAFLAFYICNLLIYWTGWQTVSRMMIAMMIGLIYFLVRVCYQKNGLLKRQWLASWWIFPYLASMSLASYLGTFGNGRNILPFGIDFAVIGLISLVAFLFALLSLKKEREESACESVEKT